jgi:hypothetical protein
MPKAGAFHFILFLLVAIQISIYPVTYKPPLSSNDVENLPDL